MLLHKTQIRTRNSAIATESTGPAQNTYVVDPPQCSTVHGDAEQPMEEVDDAEVNDTTLNANRRACFQPQLLGDNPAYLRNIFVMDDAHFYFHGEEIHIGTPQAQALYTPKNHSFVRNVSGTISFTKLVLCYCARKSTVNRAARKAVVTFNCEFI
ncbi:hypothetical protein DdX_20223 [Ditylenchus destructor]|uniref:Uncharacterized protein n=1 Tax=Ditylenchus destructor TaxID=166010 RepID=A0AAD4MHK1_9BILA|nr:hypothetical protein DdX_20223 [Ditylenchus destructor]